MPLAIDFEWERDQAGYRVVPAPAPDRWSIAVDVYRLDKTAVPPERQDQATRAGLDAGGAQLPDALIMRRGGELVRHRPLERVPGLFRVFAGRARTKEGLLDFVNQFGPLTEKGQDPEGEPVGIGLSDAAIMRQLLGCD